MDVYANDVLSRYSSKVDLSVAWLPRNGKPYPFRNNRYTLLYDPIDGSSNTDTNLSLVPSLPFANRKGMIRMVKRLIYSKMGANKSRLGTSFMVPAPCWFILLVRVHFHARPQLGDLSFRKKISKFPTTARFTASMRATSGNGMNQSGNTSAMSTAQKAIPLAIVELWLATSIEF